MASLNRGISFRRQGSSGMSWADTWSFNEDGVLVRTMKDEVLQQQQQRFAGSALARIHDSHTDELQEQQISSPPPSLSSSYPRSPLTRSKSVGSGACNLQAHHRQQTPPPLKPSAKFFKWIKRALNKLKK